MASRSVLCRMVRAGRCAARITHGAYRATPGVLSRGQHHLNSWQHNSTGLHTSSVRLNENIMHIQDQEDFDKRVLANPVPVVLDFHATWCGPCKLLGPRLESLVAKKAGKVIMAKVDIDEHTDLAIQYGVEAVPTVIAMKDGKIQDKFVGLKDDAQLESFVDKLTG